MERQERLAELREMFQQMSELELGRADRLRRDELDREERRRTDDVDRTREDEKSRADRREEEEKKRDKPRELLSGLGNFRESRWYLEKFERMMREGEFEADEWLDKLYPRLMERLCVRVNGLREDGAGYLVINRLVPIGAYTRPRTKNR